MHVSKKHLAAAGAFVIAGMTGRGVAQAQSPWNGPVNCGSYGSPYAGNCFVTYNDSGYDGLVVNTTGGGLGVNSGSDTGIGVAGGSTSGYGVSGTSGGSHGVYGTTTSTGSSEDGVYGYNNTGLASGVAGDNENTSASCGGSNVNCFGVWGASHAGVGVYGQTYGSGGYGVYAKNFGGGPAIYGVTGGSGAAVTGNNTASSAGGYGVYGESVTTYGVYGKSTNSNGVYGYTTGSYAAGVNGQCSGTDCDGIYGQCSGTGCYAADLDGAVNIWGCLQFNGTNYYNCSSDSRLKKNVEPVANAMATLLKLKGVTYEWKNPSEHGNHATETQKGFIAQDVEKVFPSWVGEDKTGFKTLAIPPNEIAALEVESIRTLKTENDLLKERVAALESGRQPVAAGFNLNGVGFGVGGVALAGAVVFASRRKREEKPAEL